MFWSASATNAFDNLPSSQLAGDLHPPVIPAPRMNKVIAARQALIHQDYDEDNMLDQIVNSLASDAMSA